jgi:short-subunit dehydrogenase involved in D-alanine esterification of teichoic acids
MAVDTADLASVHVFAEALKSRFAAVEMLVNNAGVASPVKKK